uniref:Uncharacterized protein n=1 Tax=Phlebotomus papatasi TaxID=29031 RepID=A0A1B0DKW2_PHLPP
MIEIEHQFIASDITQEFYALLTSQEVDKVKIKVSFPPTVAHYTSGVPQGSVLGPLLFAIFTADMPMTNGVEVATYADDTVILASDANPSIASNKLQPPNSDGRHEIFPDFSGWWLCV